jgi:hypothetical protein
MAKKNSQGQPAPTQQAAAPISKQEAVRRALEHFGRDAKPTQMQGWIKDSLGIEMSTDHISTAKGIILHKKGKKAARKAAGQGKLTPQQEVAPKPPAPTGKQAALPLDDILTVKQLVVRFGAGPLHTLIDAFAR